MPRHVMRWRNFGSRCMRTFTPFGCLPLPYLMLGDPHDCALTRSVSWRSVLPLSAKVRSRSTFLCLANETSWLWCALRCTLRSWTACYICPIRARSLWFFRLRLCALRCSVFLCRRDRKLACRSLFVVNAKLQTGWLLNTM